jgi:hypothetical protein
MGNKQRKPLDIAVMTTAELIQKKLTDFTREDLYIAIPAVVTSIDDYESLQCVNVKPLINDVYDSDTGKIVEARTIKKVFVALYEGGGFKIKLPVAVGNKGRLFWSHRNITDFLAGDGSAVDEPIEMIADMNDCWFEIGFGTRSNNQSPSATDLIITNDNITTTYKPDGNLSIVTAADIYAECVNAIIKCSTKATVDSPESEFTGNVTIKGVLTVDTSINAPDISASSTLKAAGAEVVAHTHSGTVPALS